MKQERFSAEQTVAVLEAGRSRSAVGGGPSTSGSFRTDVLSVEKQDVGLEVDQIRQLNSKKKTLDGSNWWPICRSIKLPCRMFYQINSRALAAPAGGRVSARQLPSERAACMQGCPDEPRDIRISHKQRSKDGIAHAHPSNRADHSPRRKPGNCRSCWQMSNHFL